MSTKLSIQQQQPYIRQERRSIDYTISNRLRMTAQLYLIDDHLDMSMDCKRMNVELKLRRSERWQARTQGEGRGSSGFDPPPPPHTHLEIEPLVRHTVILLGLENGQPIV